MKGISGREFARRAGCSEAYIREAKKAGRIGVFSDGSLDPAYLTVNWRKGEKPSAQAAQSDREDGDLVPLAEAERIKENYLAKLRRLEFEIKSGQLVDAEKVRDALFDLWRAERDAWVNWPARIASIMAAELGCDSSVLLIALEKHVRDHLAERSAEPKPRAA